MRYLPNDTVRTVQRRALDSGAQMRPRLDGTPSRTVLWKVAGNCQSPVTVLLHGRKELKRERFVTVMTSDPASKPNFVECEVPCRKCPNCLRRRAAHWRLRAISEWRSAPRTWFATLTMSPASVIDILSRCRSYLAKGGIDFDALPDAEQFAAVADMGYRDVQRWLKRLRKNTGAPIRYLAITEAHKSGVPHWHVLIHEGRPDMPLTYDRDLKGSWHMGFDSYKLVRDQRAAGYVTKYLTKSVGARVRASSRYGDGTSPPPPNAEVQSVVTRVKRVTGAGHVKNSRQINTREGVK